MTQATKDLSRWTLASPVVVCDHTRRTRRRRIGRECLQQNESTLSRDSRHDRREATTRWSKMLVPEPEQVSGQRHEYCTRREEPLGDAAGERKALIDEDSVYTFS